VDGFDCVYQFEIDGQVWHLDLFQSEKQIKSGPHEDPDCTIQISADNFYKLLKNDLNVPMALLTGKIKIKGDKALALKLGKLFS
jgi:putative sterol carrier protein